MKKFVDVEGIRTRYYEFGLNKNRESLVLIHGGNLGIFASADDWSLNFGGLARSFHLVAFDKLGMGYTSNPKKDSDYTFEAQVKHALAFLRKISIKDAHVVGHSRGALLALCLAVRHAETTKSLTIVDSNSAAKENPALPSKRFYLELAKKTPGGPLTRDTARLGADAQSFSTGHIDEAFVEGLYKIGTQSKMIDLQRRLKYLAKTVWDPSVERIRSEISERIETKGLKVPTLIVWGANDPSAPLETGFELYNSLRRKTSDTQFHVFNQAGHYSFREHPIEFNNLLTDFCIKSRLNRIPPISIIRRRNEPSFKGKNSLKYRIPLC